MKPFDPKELCLMTPHDIAQMSPSELKHEFHRVEKIVLWLAEQKTSAELNLELLRHRLDEFDE